jgi:hypothetical protein
MQKMTGGPRWQEIQQLALLQCLCCHVPYQASIVHVRWFNFETRTVPFLPYDARRDYIFLKFLGQTIASPTGDVYCVKDVSLARGRLILVLQQGCQPVL